MTWGALYMYYHCPKIVSEVQKVLAPDMDVTVTSFEEPDECSGEITTEFGDEFGFCPECHVMGVYEKEGARQKDDNEYFEVE